jgi:hypothetical protein
MVSSLAGDYNTPVSVACPFDKAFPIKVTGEAVLDVRFVEVLNKTSAGKLDKKVLWQR